ncbi:hypothetical protein HOD96_03430 [Candidatus Falkowbacteria bacterium]|jgi:hypothetical protein|nr:hypothetical protein [Candidatus Falkowbacteria bacterium]MBT4432980.1 hypothetical protein [Candidatus Falkowbacteria bacterium]
MNQNIDLNEVTTPLMVRDAIIKCFNEAHCADAGVEGDKQLNENYCRSIVEKAFKDVGGDFNKPTRVAIIGVLDKLAEFAKNFRDKSMIEKHYNGMIKMVKRMK